MRTVRLLLITALLALFTALWLWSDSERSLAALLTLAQHWLPADQTLEARDVQGSLRRGGHIGWLRWSRGQLSVEAQDLSVAWTLPPLLQRQLRLSQLSVATLTIDDQRVHTDDTPPTPPADLSLPVTLDVPFSVATLKLTGAASLHATKISGYYVFDSTSHRLSKGEGHISSGKYRLSGSLQAASPMALALQVQGQVQTTLPASQQPLTVAAQAQLTGALAGPDATLLLQANLEPETTSGSAQPKRQSGTTQAMQAALQATVKPWQSQPLRHAQAQWQTLDLAALWPQAPRTQLTGSASVIPVGEGWQGHVELSNALAGPWNQQQLPVTALRASVDHAQGQWVLHSLHADAAQGSITGSGKFNAGQWQGDFNLQGINPAAIDSRLASAPMSGTLQARQLAEGIGFEAQVQAAQPTAKPQPTLPLQNLQIQGIWQAPLLTVSSLQLDAPNAKLQGALSYHTRNQAVQGQLTLALPGLQATLDGHLSSADGQGTLALKVQDAALANQWLGHFPLAASLRPGGNLSGKAELNASWQGGWHNQGKNLKLSASLRAPQLDWASTAQATPWQLRDLQAELVGSLPALQVSTQGKVTQGTRHFDWQARANAGQTSPGHWQGSVSQLKLGLQHSAQVGSWSLQSDTTKPIALDWQRSGLTDTLSVGSGKAQLSGPIPRTPGTATLNWETVNWSRQSPATPSATARTRWRSQGSLSGLPLVWLDALGATPLAELGIQSDLILNGQWDAAQTDTLTVKASLARSSGDLSLRTSDSRQPAQAAKVREAQLQVQLAAGELSTQLRWRSEQAGQATLDLRTHWLPQGDNGVWASDAPVSGSLQMHMPPMEAWSVLAPPGWRLRGTLDASATLSGTRQAPQWRGTLQARDMAVRSVADGIDFQHGTLQARLEGQQLYIDSFTLQGAGGSSGGQVSITGMAQWPPADTPAATLAQRVQMSLQAQATALRLSSRPDRRINVSGQLSAGLKNATLSLRGALSADQALLTLPSESAPALGDDVRVRSPAPAAPAASGATPNRDVGSAPAAKPATTQITPDVQVTLNLGPAFQVRGRGLDTQLAGKLELRAVGQVVPTLTGTVRTTRGTYQAYGQHLEIEQGILRFTGPANNPALDILAIRPKLTQRVGVQVNGTALSPVVRLFAEPELTEAEKLAWLVLGRSASASGAETAMLQQAALALLGGNGQGPSASLTQALGLDELSFGGTSGTTTAATLTVGKRLSQDFYVAYESGITGTMGVFTIFYDLSKRLTLRGRTGEQSAVDLIWTQRYD